MEDALALSNSPLIKDYFTAVLILVLMEDAPALVRPFTAKKASNRLNPCFNGRCTRTL